MLFDAGLSRRRHGPPRRVAVPHIYDVSSSEKNECFQVQSVWRTLPQCPETHKRHDRPCSSSACTARTIHIRCPVGVTISPRTRHTLCNLTQLSPLANLSLQHRNWAPGEGIPSRRFRAGLVFQAYVQEKIIASTNNERAG